MSKLNNVINNVDSEMRKSELRKFFRFHNRKLLKFGIFWAKTLVDKMSTLFHIICDSEIEFKTHYCGDAYVVLLYQSNTFFNHTVDWQLLIELIAPTASSSEHAIHYIALSTGNVENSQRHPRCNSTCCERRSNRRSRSRCGVNPQSGRGEEYTCFTSTRCQATIRRSWHV